MTVISATINVHRSDDVTFGLDTDEFLDGVGPVDDKIEVTLNEVLDAYLEAHAEYDSQCWYGLDGEEGSRELLKSALAKALSVDADDVWPEYEFCTSNWESLLTEDFGGTLWHIADGREYLTIESGDYGRMKVHVDVRSVECEDPSYVIASCSSNVMIGCTYCSFTFDTSHQRAEWERFTRSDDAGLLREGLYCPDCGYPMVAEVYI
jgi:hypothetical protein